VIEIISGIILAAGSSKRMGKQKLLLPFKNSTILEEVIKIVKSCSALNEVIVVYKSEEVLNAIKKYDVKPVYNPNAEKGQSTSVVEGIKSCHPETKAYMFIMGDQPFINLDIINAIIEVWNNNPNSIIVPKYDGKNGMPTLFPSNYKQGLLNITGDKGGRDIIKANPDNVINVDFSNTLAGFDIDTIEDYNECLKKI